MLFIFEMANNHMGDLAHGRRIVRELKAACAGFDFRFAVKLQYRDLATLIHPDYAHRTDFKFIKRFTETALGWDHLRSLRDTIGESGFLAVCTPWDESSVDKVAEHGFDYLKVSSASLTDWPLAEKIAETRLPVILSTAGTSFDEIDRAAAFYRHRRKEISILHCVAEYPTAPGALQLNQIDQLRHRFPDLAVGYSTHETPDSLTPVRIAIAKGATIFEKHVAIGTEKYPVNAYSATPGQVRSWLQAARETLEICGASGGRHASSTTELSSLHDLRRGVFARSRIEPGTVIGAGNTFLAIPALPGQLTANDLSKYLEHRAVAAIEPRGAILAPALSTKATHGTVRRIVLDVRRLLQTSGAVAPADGVLEISHHYGIERFHDVGAAMITVVNREYCKRIVVLLPGQVHPEHWHGLKDETFHLLHGEIELSLDGAMRRCVKNDVVVIPRGARHGFRTDKGAVIEEISSTYTTNDSGYADPAITANSARKTFVKDWMD